jgi:hypothetical protein
MQVIQAVFAESVYARDAQAHDPDPRQAGHGCHVESGARIVRSVVFEHTRTAGAFDEQIVCGR